MKQGTKKTFHLDCVGLIVEVDRWSDRRRRETTGRHISRTVGERRREEARCGNGPTFSAPLGWRFLPGLYTWNETGLFTAHSGIDTTPLRSARAHLSITLLVTLPPLLLLLLLHREERAAISGSHIRLAARPSSLRRSSTIFKYSGPLVERASSSTATELIGWWPAVKKIDQPSDFDVERAGWSWLLLKILFRETAGHRGSRNRIVARLMSVIFITGNSRLDEFSQSSSESCLVFFSFLRRFRMIDDEYIVVIDRMFTLSWECCIVFNWTFKKIKCHDDISLFFIDHCWKLIFRSLFFSFLFFHFHGTEWNSFFFLRLALSPSCSHTKNLVQRDIMYHFNCQLLK